MSPAFQSSKLRFLLFMLPFVLWGGDGVGNVGVGRAESPCGAVPLAESLHKSPLPFLTVHHQTDATANVNGTGAQVVKHSQLFSLGFSPSFASSFLIRRRCPICPFAIHQLFPIAPGLSNNPPPDTLHSAHNGCSRDRLHDIGAQLPGQPPQAHQPQHEPL